MPKWPYAIPKYAYYKEIRRVNHWRKYGLVKQLITCSSHSSLITSWS